MQDDIIKSVAQGLPNHFSSTDHRSIQLAKFFCEILTESLKLYEKYIPSLFNSIFINCWTQLKFTIS